MINATLEQVTVAKPVLLKIGSAMRLRERWAFAKRFVDVFADSERFDKQRSEAVRKYSGPRAEDNTYTVKEELLAEFEREVKEASAVVVSYAAEPVTIAEIQEINKALAEQGKPELDLDVIELAALGPFVKE